MMGLLGKMFGKEEKKSSCCDMETVEISRGEDMKQSCECGCDVTDTEAITLTVLGPGCKRCHKLNENAHKAISLTNKKVSVDYISDPVAIANAGIISTPALLINRKVVAQGKVLTPDEIVSLL